MSTAIIPKELIHPITGVTLDAYPFGWRDVLLTLPNGEQEWTRVPLTLDDALHPQEDDVLPAGYEHGNVRNYLYTTLRYLVACNPRALVLSGINIAWDVPEIRPHRPDIAVIFNVHEQKNWSTFHVAEEGTRPTLIIEITSPKTRHLDLNDKVDEYELVDVPYYVIVDLQHRYRGVRRRRLLGWQMTPDGYAPMGVDEQGRLWMEPLKAWLALEQDKLVCYDQAGNLLEGYVELAAALDEAETALAQAEARAQAAEDRAQAEAQARADMEKRLRELEEELRKRQSGQA